MRAAAGAEVLRWPHPRAARRRSPGPDPDRPRPRGCVGGRTPCCWSPRGVDRGRGRAPVRDGAEPHPRLAGPVSGGRPPGPRRRAALGRPPKLNAAALAFLAEALEASPQAYGLPVTVWSIRDLREVLAARLGVRLHRDRAPSGAALGLPVPPPPPRPAAPPGPGGGRGGRGGPGVAAKKALAPLANSASFTWTSARSTVTPAWRRCGSGGCPLVPAAEEDGKFAVFRGARLRHRPARLQTAEHKDGAAFVAFLDHPGRGVPRRGRWSWSWTTSATTRGGAPRTGGWPSRTGSARCGCPPTRLS